MLRSGVIFQIPDTEGPSMSAKWRIRLAVGVIIPHKSPAVRYRLARYRRSPLAFKRTLERLAG
jgi:hypothetical protein